MAFLNKELSLARDIFGLSPETVETLLKYLSPPLLAHIYITQLDGINLNDGYQLENSLPSVGRIADFQDQIMRMHKASQDETRMLGWIQGDPGAVVEEMYNGLNIEMSVVPLNIVLEVIIKRLRESEIQPRIRFNSQLYTQLQAALETGRANKLSGISEPVTVAFTETLDLQVTIEQLKENRKQTVKNFTLKAVFSERKQTRQKIDLERQAFAKIDEVCDFLDPKANKFYSVHLADYSFETAQKELLIAKLRQKYKYLLLNDELDCLQAPDVPWFVKFYKDDEEPGTWSLKLIFPSEMPNKELAAVLAERLRHLNAGRPAQINYFGLNHEENTSSFVADLLPLFQWQFRKYIHSLLPKELRLFLTTNLLKLEESRHTNVASQLGDKRTYFDGDFVWTVTLQRTNRLHYRLSFYQVESSHLNSTNQV